MSPPINTVDNILSRCRYEHGCWVWTGSLARGGYAKTKMAGRTVLAHRVVYEEIVGRVTDGRQLDHLCRNPACVNPHHLEQVTALTNVLRSAGFAAVNAAKTHCKYGHSFSGSNLIFRGRARVCRQCRNAAALVAFYTKTGRTHTPTTRVNLLNRSG